MTNWLDRYFVTGCILAAVAQFVVAGINVYGAFQNYPSAVQDAALWTIFGLFWICMAVVFRPRAETTRE
jgi:hypothetical protein